MNTRNKAFEDGLKSLGRTLTPEQLQEKGVRKVRAVKASVLADLIESAVNRTVLQQTQDMLPGTRHRLLLQARRELDRLVGLRDHLEDARENLREARRFDPAPAGDERAAVQGGVESLRDRFAGLLDQAGEAGAVRDDLLQAASAALHRAVEQVARARERELERMRGRIHKLLDALTGTEEALDEVLSHMGGVRSGFRASQRVTPEDPAGQERLDMMAGLFRENRALGGEARGGK